MLAIIDDGRPGRGHVHVAWAHRFVAVIYGLAIASLVPVLYHSIRSPGPGDTAFGLSVFMVSLCALMTAHIVTAWGSLRQRNWARIVSRYVAFLFFPAIPVGTAFAMYVLANTRSDRWTSKQVGAVRTDAPAVPPGESASRSA
jgi:hypothetical protein